MLKICSVVGTRPELIRLSLIIKKLDKVCNHILVHTGQNYNPLLKDIFFEELSIRQPNYLCKTLHNNSFAHQMQMIFLNIERILEKEKPDKVLILGDTNSALSAIVAERMQIPVYHCESGNRCYSKEVPEELNRKIIDHISSYNLPYTPRSRDNLIAEGLPLQRIYLTGNPIKEVIDYYSVQIYDSQILNKLNLYPQKYFLSTFHRSECVDKPDRLEEIIEGLNRVSEYGLPIIVSTHPHTRSKLENYAKGISKLINFLDPMGLFDFIKLEKNALCVLSDSGTVSEETCILHTPNVIIRETTERPETLEVGSSILSGINRDSIFNSTEIMLNKSKSWKLPEGYDEDNVSERVISILLSKGE